jgi:hypothetical protein
MLILAVLVFCIGTAAAAAQDGPARIARVTFATTTASSTGARVVFTSQPAPARPRGHWAGRHPVLLGTMIGAGSVGGWEPINCGGQSCHVGTAALVGAGAGAYGGVIASQFSARGVMNRSAGAARSPLWAAQWEVWLQSSSPALPQAGAAARRRLVPE